MRFLPNIGYPLFAVLTFLIAACSTSVEEVSKTQPVEIEALLTTANPPGGISQALSITLTCTPYEGRPCTVYIREQVNDQPQTPKREYIGPIAPKTNATTILSFWAEDEKYIGPVKTETYIIDTVKPTAT